MLGRVICLHVPWDTSVLRNEWLVILTDTRDYNEDKKITMIKKIV